MYKLMSPYWRLKQSYRWFKENICQPRSFPRPLGFNNFAHRHICLALRLINHKDFRIICPLVKQKGLKYTKENAEYDDVCDSCIYNCRIDQTEDNIIRLALDNDLPIERVDLSQWRHSD